MAEEFGTRDVLEQVGSRMANLEQDQRALRSEVREGFAEQRGHFQAELSALRSDFRWLIGIFFAGWLSVLGSIWLKP